MKATIWIAILAFLIGSLCGILVTRQRGVINAPVALPAKVAVTSAPVSERNSLISSRSEATSSWAVRAQTFVDFKKKRGGLSVGAVNEDSVDIVFALMLGLTSAEVERLNRSLSAAKAQMEHLREGTAQFRMSEDLKTKIVSLPPLGTEATPIYQSVVSEFASVLGPERYDFLNQVAGGRFDGLFDHFGADSVVYEISADPVQDREGRMTYQYKRTSQEGGPTGATNWSNRTFIDGKEDDPIVVKYVHSR